MAYRRQDAKDWARENMRGVWAAALTPFRPDMSIDEAGLRSNLRHWFNDLGVDGVFIAGKQGEFFALTLEERKLLFRIALEESQRAGTKAIMSCSDQNMDIVIELAKYAEAIGAESIVVHAPVLHFLKAHDETIYEYYKYISEQVNLGIALWSHPIPGIC